MADISAFSNATFNPSAWINSVLKNKPDEESLESYLASLAMKIHVVSQDYTDQLENGMMDAIASMPRVISEISRMEEALRNLDTELLSLTDQLASFDDKNAIAVEELSRLDTLKVNIETCKGTLEEHARWNQMVREAWLLLENGGRLADAADRVEAMIKSLEILKNVPGHFERAQTCDSMISELFNALQPKIRSDVAAMNLSALKEYIYVHEKLGRSEELEEEYATLRPTALKAAWKSYKNEDFAQWLCDYFASLQTFLQEENRTMLQLFGATKTPIILSKMLLKITEPISNELSIRLEDTAKRGTIVGNQTALITYAEAENFAAVSCKILCAGGHVPTAIVAMNLVSILSGFIQFSEQFVENNDSTLREELRELLDNSIMFEVSQNNSLFDDAFDDELQTKRAVIAPQSGYLEGRKIIQALDPDNLDDLLGVLERFSEKILQVSDESYTPLSNTIRNSCSFVKGLKAKSAVKFTISTMKHHFRSILQKLMDLRSATGLNALESSEWFPLVSTKSSREPGAIPPSPSVTVGSGGALHESHPGLPMTTTTDIALGIAKHYGLVGQERTSVAKLLIPPALKSLQSVGRLFLRFIEFESYTANQLANVLELLFHGLPIEDYLNRVSSDAVGLVNGSTIGSRVISGVLESDLQGFSELKGFLMHAVDAVAKTRLSNTREGPLVAAYADLSVSSQVLFSSATPVLQQLRFAAGSLLFDLCTLAPEAILKDFSGWSDCSNDSDYAISEDSESGYDSLLPQTAITQVGEHLLSLVNEIETFATSEAIYDLVPLHGTASDLIIKAQCWRDLLPLVDVKEAVKNPTDVLCRRQECANQLNIWRQLIKVDESSLSLISADDIVEEDKSIRFVNEWLTAFADYTVGIFLVRVLKSDQLSTKGCFQLSADVNYLINVTSALGIAPHPLLLHFKDIFANGKLGAIKLLSPSEKITSSSNLILRYIHKQLLVMLSDKKSGGV